MKYLARIAYAASLLAAATSLDAAQIITPAETQAALGSADTASFRPVYSVSAPTTGTATGLGIRVHFDTAALQLTSVNNVFAYGMQPQGELTADTQNLDGDATTDSYFILGWTDVAAQWPGNSELPLTLADIRFTPQSGFSGTTRIRTTATATADETLFQSTPMTLTVTTASALQVSVRGALQGAYSAGDGLMRDDLRTAGLLPLTQPYSAKGYNGTETTTAGMLAVSGNDAVVDWVLVELRDKLDPNIRVAAQAALLQRDGDVVDAADGNPALTFPGLATGDYHVALRHRNHLGAMSASLVALSGEAATVDFTLPETGIYGDKDIRVQQGDLTRLLPAGDAGNDNKLIAEGPGNDRNTVLGTVLAAPGNTGMHVNYQLQDYAATDVNMDGKTLFVGPGNDINTLLGNILLAPDNATSSTNFILNGTTPD